MKKLLNNLRRKQTPEERAEISAVARQQIITDAEAMKRLSQNEDYIRFNDILRTDKEKLISSLLDENTNTLKSAEQKIRLIARINQIDRTLNKPKSLIWQMETLTEVRGAIKDQTRERQALGNKTGG